MAVLGMADIAGALAVQPHARGSLGVALLPRKFRLHHALCAVERIEALAVVLRNHGQRPRACPVAKTHDART